MKRSHVIVVGLASLGAFPGLSFSASLLGISSIVPAPLDPDGASQAIVEWPKISLPALPPISIPKLVEPAVELDAAGSVRNGPGSLIIPKEIAALEESGLHGIFTPFAGLPIDRSKSVAQKTAASPFKSLADSYGASKSINYHFQLYGKIRGKKMESNRGSLKLHLRTPKGSDWQAPITVGPKGKYSVELVLAALPDQTIEWAVTGSGVGIDAELAAGRRILTDAKDLVIKENIRTRNP